MAQAATTSIPTFEFNKERDRCDQGQCGAEAKVRVLLGNGFDLMFCKHHGDANSAKLTIAGGTFFFSKS
jgi:hypothetical protein